MVTCVFKCWLPVVLSLHWIQLCGVLLAAEASDVDADETQAVKSDNEDSNDVNDFASNLVAQSDNTKKVDPLRISVIISQLRIHHFICCFEATWLLTSFDLFNNSLWLIYVHRWICSSYEPQILIWVKVQIINLHLSTVSSFCFKALTCQCLNLTVWCWQSHCIRRSKLWHCIYFYLMNRILFEFTMLVTFIATTRNWSSHSCWSIRDWSIFTRLVTCNIAMIHGLSRLVTCNIAMIHGLSRLGLTLISSCVY